MIKNYFFDMGNVLTLRNLKRLCACLLNGMREAGVPAKE